jgi:putative FmdB family regulatory protein
MVLMSTAKSANALKFMGVGYVAHTMLKCCEPERKQMPVYDFKCECGKTSTITIGIADLDKFVCKCICGKPMVRQFGVGAITFKGSGWGKDKN